MDSAARARLDRWMQPLIKSADSLLDVASPDLAIADDPIQLAERLADGKDVCLREYPAAAGFLSTVRTPVIDGEHRLWLVLGTLTWIDREQREYTSPIIFLPVSVDDDRVVAAIDGLPRVNQALAERLRVEHGLGLEPATAGNHVDISSHLDAAGALCVDRPGWEVVRCARIGVYSLSDHDMWRDLSRQTDEMLAPMAWLLGLEAPAALPELASDPTMCAPLDADAHQLAAIRTAAAGGSFLLQGAPGTGKSHTVANLAAHCVSLGLSTLIVSDRKVALDEVERRLAGVGLGDACVFAGQPLPRLSRRSRAWTGRTTSGEQLAQLAAGLDEYVSALHGSTPIGLSIRQILARLTELRTTPNAAVADADAVALDRTTYERRRSAVEELAVAARLVEPVGSHPWRASKLGAWAWDGASLSDGDVGPRSSMVRGRAAQALETATETTAALVAALADLSRLVPGILTRTPEELRALGALAELAAASPRPGAELFSTVRSRIDDVGETIALIRVRGGGEIDVPRDPASYMAIATRHRALVAEIYNQLSEEGVDLLDAPLLWSQLKKWGASAGPLRFVALRSARAQIRAASLPLQVWSDDAMLTVVEAIIAENACREALERAAEPAQRWFGDLVDDPRNLDLATLEAAIEWTGELRRAFERVATADGDAGQQATWRALIAQVVAPTTNLGVFVRVADAVARWLPALAELAAATGIEPELLGVGDDHLAALGGQIDSLQQAIDKLVDWTRFHRARQHALDAGVVAAVGAIDRGDLSAEDLAAAWDRASLLEWLSAEIEKRPILAGFDGAQHHARVARYADLDRGEMAIVRGRLSPRAACVLATPQTVASASLPTFDVVVFEDASRIPVGHALGAIARGRSVVCVGDPSLRSVGGADSLLDAVVAAGWPEIALTTHYRSQHHNLFAFANRRFYGDEVRVVPAACDSQDVGVRWRLVEGASDTTGENRAEAQAIVDDIAIRISRGQRSFAVAVLSESQQRTIEQLLAGVDLADASALIGGGVLVGTSDLLHGEERDVVYLSVGYDAPSLRAVCHADTERWLRVATTRARNELVVVSSFSPEAVADDHSQTTRSVAELIDFARSRALATIDQRQAGDAIADAIGRALVERGWKVRHRVGIGVGEVELAVLDPDDASRCVLAIEHDGTVYAGEACARDRDRQREQQLVRFGWRVHRVWSLDWWNHPEREIQRTHAAIVTAIAAGRQRAPSAIAPEKRRASGSGPVVAAGKAVAAESSLAQGTGPTLTPDGSGMVPVRLPRGSIAIGPYTAAAIPCGRRLPDDMFGGRHCGELAKVVEQVLAAEAPIHVDLLSRRAAAYFGVGRVTGRIADQVRSVLEGRGQFGDEPDIIWRADQDPMAVPAVRVAGSNPVACRDIAEIPLAEVAAAARIVVERASGLAQPELIRDCARLLGFARLTERVTERVARGVQLAAGRELISIDNGRAHLTI